MYYRIKAITIRTGHESTTQWMNSKLFSTLFEEAMEKCDLGMITSIEETEFLVLNGINSGKGSTNQYKPTTVF